MNRVEAALSKFRRPYSCAQTMWVAFKNEDEKFLSEMKANSGGRSEGGICGALYAARKILPESSRQKLDELFASQAGSLKCKEIKSLAKTPCQECVRIAASIVESLSE